jgi:nucleotidyltransferase/DNA polymerase involved in DNA repair
MLNSERGAKFLYRVKQTSKHYWLGNTHRRTENHSKALGGGAVLAASYEARAYGVRGGMPGRRARELCPQLVFVGGHFQDYQRLGDAVIKVINDFTPLVERISIDEAFADAPPWDSTKPLGGSLLLVNEERLETTATILHADLDAFYASVEQLTL